MKFKYLPGGSAERWEWTYGKNVALATLPTANNATPTNRLRVIRCLCKLVSGFIVHEAGCELDAAVQSGEMYGLFFF